MARLTALPSLGLARAQSSVPPPGPKTEAAATPVRLADADQELPPSVTGSGGPVLADSNLTVTESESGGKKKEKRILQRPAHSFFLKQKAVLKNAHFVYNIFTKTFPATLSKVSPKRSKRDACMHTVTDPSAMAAAVSCAVTALADRECPIARNGDLSIFSAYRRIFPQAKI